MHMVARRHMFSWRHHCAVARDADFLDGVVDAQLDLIRQLPIDQRDELAEALSVLVILAQDHRYYLRNWINRRELRHRTERALVSLDALGQVPSRVA
ncbi:MAG: hypothetical protein LC721_06025 [Actinobacteria bacterium]|nr:hypothetical protein [Actinomycetota bacterium]